MSNAIISSEVQMFRTFLIAIVVIVAFWLYSAIVKKYGEYRVNNNSFPEYSSPVADILMVTLIVFAMSLFTYVCAFHRFPRTYLVFADISLVDCVDTIKSKISISEGDSIRIVAMPTEHSYNVSEAKKNLAKISPKCEVVAHINKKQLSGEDDIHSWTKGNGEVLEGVDTAYIVKSSNAYLTTPTGEHVTKSANSMEELSLAKLKGEEKEEEKKGEKKDGPQEGEHP